LKKLIDKDLFRPDEAAAYFDVSKKTIYLWVEIGELQAVKIGGVLRIPKSAMLAIQKPIFE